MKMSKTLILLVAAGIFLALLFPAGVVPPITHLIGGTEASYDGDHIIAEVHHGQTEDVFFGLRWFHVKAASFFNLFTHNAAWALSLCEIVFLFLNIIAGITLFSYLSKSGIIGFIFGTYFSIIPTVIREAAARRFEGFTLFPILFSLYFFHRTWDERKPVLAALTTFFFLLTLANNYFYFLVLCGYAVVYAIVFGLKNKKSLAVTGVVAASIIVVMALFYKNFLYVLREIFIVRPGLEIHAPINFGDELTQYTIMPIMLFIGIALFLLRGWKSWYPLTVSLICGVMACGYYTVYKGVYYILPLYYLSQHTAFWRLRNTSLFFSFYALFLFMFLALNAQNKIKALFIATAGLVSLWLYFRFDWLNNLIIKMQTTLPLDYSAWEQLIR